MTNRVILTMMLLVAVSVFTACKHTKSLTEQREEESRRNVEKLKAKYQGWQPGDTRSIELSILDHYLKVNGEHNENRGKYEEFTGTSEEAVSQAQARSIAQANAYAEFARTMSSTIEANASKLGVNEKKMGEADAVSYENFKEDFKINAIMYAGNLLERSYTFLKKTENGWKAETVYIYAKNQDLDAQRSILKKTLENTKLTVKEKLWLKNLMNELNK